MAYPFAFSAKSKKCNEIDSEGQAQSLVARLYHECQQSESLLFSKNINCATGSIINLHSYQYHQPTDALLFLSQG